MEHLSYLTGFRIFFFLCVLFSPVVRKVWRHPKEMLSRVTQLRGLPQNE